MAVCRERLPVSHRHRHACIAALAQLGLQRGRLPDRMFQDRTLAADLRVVVRHVFGAGRGDQPRQRLAGNSREGKIDDVRIAEEIVQEGFDACQTVRTPQLKQHYPEFHR